jgi:inner membrane protein
MGEAFAGRTLGKKAMWWGALAQTAPDIDFIASFWMDTPGALLAHRGFTHSFLFFLLITPVFALLAEKFHRPHNIRLGKWILFFGGVILVHILVDSLNNYGVGWFEPFSHQRISFNTIYVADPFFSLWPAIALVVLLFKKWWDPSRKYWVRVGLGISAVYLLYCTVNKIKIDRDVAAEINQRQIQADRYFTTPAPLQNWLWYVVAGNDSGYYIGFRSLFDTKKDIHFNFFPRNDSLLKEVSDHEELQKLIRFSQQFYAVEKWNDTLVFNDLRFGQIVGWHDPNQRFVFHYFLHHPHDNRLVVQRGRFTGWNKETFFSLLRRIKGNE